VGFCFNIVMSRRIEGKELRDLADVIEVAKEVAKTSTCNKDHRGVVVFRKGEIISQAANGPISPYQCEPEMCEDICGLFAMHAERLALIKAMAQGAALEGASVLHVRVKDGEIQISGPLRCEDCTGYMMRLNRKGIGLKEFILLQKDGWIAYEIDEADELTRLNLGI